MEKLDANRFLNVGLVMKDWKETWNGKELSLAMVGIPNPELIDLNTDADGDTFVIVGERKAIDLAYE